MPLILPHSEWVQGLDRRSKSRRQWNTKHRSKAGEPRQLKTASKPRPGLDGSRFLQWVCEPTSFSSTELEDVPAQGWGPPVFLLQPNHWKDSSCPGTPGFIHLPDIEDERRQPIYLPRLFRNWGRSSMRGFCVPHPWASTQPHHSSSKGAQASDSTSIHFSTVKGNYPYRWRHQGSGRSSTSCLSLKG